MSDGDDLPDHDYESIYGYEAMHARQLARMDAYIRQQAQTRTRLDALIARMEARRAPHDDENVVP